MIPLAETQKRKKEALIYLDKVIDQMSLADRDMTSIIRRNISTLIESCMKYNSLGKKFHFSANPELEQEVNSVLYQLRKDIFNIIYLRAENASIIAYQKENEEYSNKYLIAIITAEIADKTLEMRIEQYVSYMRSEVEAFVAAGISKGMSRDQILNDYINFLKAPYTAPLLLEAFREKGFVAERIVSKGITFGTGKYVSAYNNLKRLEQDTIFRVYNYNINSIWLGQSNILGWYTVRGSNYPCPICDDQIGQFHDKYEFFYGYHTRCCCIMIPVYITDII